MTVNLSSYKYLMGSRMLTHVCFWVLYYVFFSLLWAKEGQYYQSFGLELILMPIRIGASYITIYWLIPKYLFSEKWSAFGLYYLLMLVVAAFLQRIFTFYFHELLFEQDAFGLWSIIGITRAVVLINTTVIFLSALKIYDYWRQERAKNEVIGETLMVIRSDSRNYRVRPSEILFVEGLGNYVTFYFEERKPIISYQKLKELEVTLPDQFARIHKSFIINKDKIQSYSSENVDINNRMIPIGKSVDLQKIGLN